MIGPRRHSWTRETRPLSPLDGGRPGDAASDRNAETTPPSNSTSQPEHVTSLMAVRRDAYALLRRGVVDRRSAFHTPVFVTHGRDGFPAARTLVLRGFDADRRALVFHSGRRSGKIAEITANDRADCVFYDPRKKIQIRATGRCRIHHQDNVARRAWQRLPVFSRRCCLAESPGLISGGPTSGLPPELERSVPELDESEQGYANFVVIRFHMLELEWLYLSAHGHRRAGFEWSKIGVERAVWLTP
jgi:pyridoxamine 5'-phosphate oxidase